MQILKKVTSRDWHNILEIMDFDKRMSGYVDYNNDGELRFFYTNPKINGSSAFFVTREDVLEYRNKK